MLKLVFGDETMNRTQTFDRFSKFKDEMTSVDDAGSSRHWSTSKADEETCPWRQTRHYPRVNGVFGKMWRTGGWFLYPDSVPAQCLVCEGICGQKRHDCCSVPSLLPRSCTLRAPPLPEFKLHILIPYLFKIRFNIIRHLGLCLGLTSVLLSSGSPAHIL